MRHSMESSHKIRCLVLGSILLCALFFVSLFEGKYPLTWSGLLSGDELQLRVFIALRLSRTVVACFGGFALGVAGFVFQTVFRNPLASPDIIGVSSGASAGAAAGILFFSTGVAVVVCAFGGAVLAVILALAFSAIDRSGKHSSVVLAGIAVHSIAQTVLMSLKMMADPERELASIEYWIMGSLNAISSHGMAGHLLVCVLCLAALFLLHRQTLLLAGEESEARMLGADVKKLRLILLILSTVAVSCVVSLTGIISFVGLLAPHCAKKLTGDHTLSTMLLGGVFGGAILTMADILARSVAATELPVSIFTSLIGAPFLILLIMKERQKV